jgi:hypothetical protein
MNYLPESTLKIKTTLRKRIPDVVNVTMVPHFCATTCAICAQQMFILGRYNDVSADNISAAAGPRWAADRG